MSLKPGDRQGPRHRSTVKPDKTYKELLLEEQARADREANRKAYLRKKKIKPKPVD